MNREKNIFARIKSDYDMLTSMGFTVVGVFLQGSQNYELDYEGSDIDTKAIVLPSFEDFVLNKKPVSTTHVLPSNEHVDIKDIRLMFECFKKQNINFLEVLFTKYYYLNPEFTELYKPMLDNAELIAHYNNYAAANCIAGMVFEKRAALCHPYPSLVDKIEKYGYDPKQLHHIFRCTEFLNRYVSGVSYKECLIPSDKTTLIQIKRDPIVFYKDVNEAIAAADACVDTTKKVKETYMQNNPVCINSEVDIIMKNVLLDILRKHFIMELSSNK